MAIHQLNGNIGTDPNFTPATHTGHSRSHVKASHDHPKMKLTAKEQEIYDGKKGDVLQKAIKRWWPTGSSLVPRSWSISVAPRTSR
jgi:hypothetical protein